MEKEQQKPLDKPKELCEHCHKNDAEADHTCPYAADIHDDYETLCNCCEDCQYECAQDI